MANYRAAGSGARGVLDNGLQSTCGPVDDEAFGLGSLNADEIDIEHQSRPGRNDAAGTAVAIG